MKTEPTYNYTLPNKVVISQPKGKIKGIDFLNFQAQQMMEETVLIA
jgi:hypothetical protein